MEKLIFTLEKYAAKYIVLLSGKLLKIKELTARPQSRCIYLFWHRNLLPLLYLYRHKGVVILISSSKDGEYIAGPAELLGYQTVRGSSNRNNINSLRSLINLGKKYSLAITPDGPLGPREIVKESVIYLAYKTNLPLVIVAVDIEKEWLIRSWDIFRIPKPLSVVRISYGKPIHIKDKEDIENKRLTIQRLMDNLTANNRENIILPDEQ